MATQYQSLKHWEHDNFRLNYTFYFFIFQFQNQRRQHPIFRNVVRFSVSLKHEKTTLRLIGYKLFLYPLMQWFVLSLNSQTKSRCG